MDFLFSLHRADLLPPHLRVEVADVRDYARHLLRLGPSGSLVMDVHHTPNGEGFTLHPARRGLDMLRSFMHQTAPRETEPTLVVTAHCGEDGAAVLMLEDGQGNLRTWREGADPAQWQDQMKEAIFDWILRVSAQGHQAPSLYACASARAATHS